MTEESLFKWRQEGTRVVVGYPKGEIFFEMPEEFKLENIHPDLIMLANYCLFSTYYPVPIYEHVFTRNPGKKIGLAFSGGVDSTAAMLLLPEDIELVYHQRQGFPVTGMRQDNALYMFENMKKKVWKIKSDQEIIGEREETGKRGFSTDYCAGVAIILMADMLDLGYFATGQMMESTHLRRGYKFRDFEKTKFWLTFEPLFKEAGLTLLGPVFSCSEVITNKIVEQSEYKDLAQSCVRGFAGQGCNACYKCFRKNLIRGKKIPTRSYEINHILTSRPLKQAASLIYAMNKFKSEILELDEYKGMELKFVERYYPPALELIPEEIKIGVKEKLEEFGIEPMTSAEINEMGIFDISK